MADLSLFTTFHLRHYGLLVGNVPNVNVVDVILKEYLAYESQAPVDDSSGK